MTCMIDFVVLFMVSFLISVLVNFILTSKIRQENYCPYFGLNVTLHMGFKANVVLPPAHLLACAQ